MGSMGFLLIMLVLLVFMMWSGNRSRKKMQNQQEEHRRRMDEGMVPGAWVKTSVGFWGRFADRDGDVVILETPGGTETYWDVAAVRDIGEPPFAADEPEAPVEEEPEKPVLGLEPGGPSFAQTPEPPSSSDVSDAPDPGTSFEPPSSAAEPDDDSDTKN